MIVAAAAASAARAAADLIVTAPVLSISVVPVIVVLRAALKVSVTSLDTARVKVSEYV